MHENSDAQQSKIFYRRKLTAAGIVALLICFLSLPGLLSLQLDTNLGKIFQLDEEKFSNYNRFLTAFPTAESEFLIIIQGSVFSTQALNTVHTANQQLRQLDGVHRVIAVLTLPGVEELTLDPVTYEPLANIDPATAEAIQQMVFEKHYEFLLSDDQTSQLILLETRADVTTDTQRLNILRDGIQTVLQNTLQSNGMSFTIGGFPEMKVGLKQQVADNMLKLNAYATLFATLIAIFLFRSWRILVAISIGPALGVLWTLSLMGWSDQALDVLNVIIPPLLFVIGYTNAVHIVFRTLDLSTTARGPWQNAWLATLDISKACLLSAVTTGIGFMSLVLSSSEMISKFGLYAGIGTILTFLAVLLVTPLCAAWLNIAQQPNATRIVNFGSSAFTRLADWIHLRQIPIIIVSILMVSGALLLALQSEADYSFKENFDPDSHFHRTVVAADRQFSGILPVSVLIEWRDDEESIELLRFQQQIHQLARDKLNTERISSAYSLMDHPSMQSQATLEKLSAALPPFVLERFVNTEAKIALLNIPMQDLGSRVQLPKLKRFQAQLKLLTDQYPQFEVTVNGLFPLAMHGSQAMIKQIARSLFFAVCVIFLVLTIALKSARLGLTSLIPNAIPIACAAAILVLTGTPLQYTSVLVFTICLGIAVDDTVHFLIRFGKEYAIYQQRQQALRQSIQKVGAVLVFTTLILGAGLLSLVINPVEVTSRMGLLSCLALLLALVADLIFLPALLLSKFNASGK